VCLPEHPSSRLIMQNLDIPRVSHSYVVRHVGQEIAYRLQRSRLKDAGHSGNERIDIFLLSSRSISLPPQYLPVFCAVSGPKKSLMVLRQINFPHSQHRCPTSSNSLPFSSQKPCAALFYLPLSFSLQFPNFSTDNR
jgi:hypothetical protein